MALEEETRSLCLTQQRKQEEYKDVKKKEKVKKKNKVPRAEVKGKRFNHFE